MKRLLDLLSGWIGMPLADWYAYQAEEWWQQAYLLACAALLGYATWLDYRAKRRRRVEEAARRLGYEGRDAP